MANTHACGRWSHVATVRWLTVAPVACSVTSSTGRAMFEPPSHSACVILLIGMMTESVFPTPTSDEPATSITSGRLSR